MHLGHLSLTDFRSHAEVELDLQPGPVALVGRNGAGKTNLIEAIGYLAALQSHRVATDAPLVRAGADQAIIRGLVHREDRDLLLEVEITAGRANRGRVNKAPLTRVREIVGLLRTVLFAPEDLGLVKGDPAGRRRFVDEVLVSRNPRYAGVIADYDRALRQRNSLLKSARAARRGGDLSTLDAWDAHLARYGSELLAGRLELVRALGPCVAKAHDEVASSGVADSASAPNSLMAGMTMAYRSTLGGAVGDSDAPDGVGGPDLGSASRDELSELMLADMARLRTAELDRGVSLVGPHRDDLVLSLGAFPAKGYASHGESWSIALALRLGSYDLLASDGGEPVLLLDDVFAELDTRRRDSLAELVSRSEQVIVSAAVVDDVPPALLGMRVDVGPLGVSRG